MDREVEAFVRFCRFERRLAELTSSAYERDVRACLKYLRVQGVESWSDVRPPDLRAFLADEAVRRPTASSQARTVAALKGFFRFCVESERLERDPALVLRTPKKREALPDVLDRHELKRPMHAPDLAVWEREHHGKRERDRLLLALFAYAGLRRSEQRPRRSGGTARSASSLTWCEQAQARHAAHAAPRVRLRAAACRCQPPANPGAARPPPPRLDAALHARDRTPAAWSDQAVAVVRAAEVGPRVIDTAAPVGRWLARASETHLSTSVQVRLSVMEFLARLGSGGRGLARSYELPPVAIFPSGLFVLEEACVKAMSRSVPLQKLQRLCAAFLY
jgi:hypothetical protein